MTLWAADSLIPLNESLYWLMRLAASVGGAFLGWFLTGPTVRISYRVAKGKPMPGWAVPWCKLLGAAFVGLLIYLLFPLGGNQGGLGFGPGQGGLPGKGDGKSDNPTSTPADPKPSPSVTPPPQKATRDIVEIELLGGRRFPGNGKYYLLQRTGPPQTLDEIETYFRAHKDRLEVHLIVTDESVGLRHNAVTRLRELANTYRIPLVDPPETKDAEK